MNSELYAKMNIKTKTLYERYLKIVDDKMALIMACVEGGQEELVTPVLELQRTDQQILAEETFTHLVPRQELYPEQQVYNALEFVSLDSVDREKKEDEDDIEYIMPSDDDTVCDDDE